jgi:zinc protease
VVMRDARVDQPAWSRHYLAPSYVAGDNEHAYALELLAEIIGGGATGRIYRSIVVDQSLAASAGAWYSPGNLDLTTFGLWFSPRPGVAVDTVRDALHDQIANLIKDGITADELKRAKQRLIDSAIFARDSVGGPARVLGAALASGQTVADVEAWPDRIRAVTVEQVDAAAREVFNENRSTTGVLLPAEGDSRT